MATGGQSQECFVGGSRVLTAGQYRTNSGILVSVFNANITKLEVDAVVSSDTNRLEHAGGVSKAIADAAGADLQREAKQYVKQNGPLKVTEVAATTGGGQLRCGRVLHTVGPRWSEYRDKARCQQHLVDTVFNCLEAASRLGLTSIALPAISSGNFGVPENVCAESYVSAVERFDRPQGDTSLHCIQFVDTRDSMTDAMKSAFAQRLHAADDNTLRIVLVGKTGAGKSATGNSLLGRQAFLAKRALQQSVTQQSTLEYASKDGLEFQIVDTPGLLDPKSFMQKSEVENIQREILKSLTLLMPGPHVILVVFRGDDRFTDADVSVYRKVQDLFPELNKYMMLVFTHTESDELLDELLDAARDTPLEGLLNDCGRRVAAIDNKAGQNQFQTVQLIQKIRDLKAANRGNHYSNNIMRRCYDLILSTGKSLEEVKKEVIAGNDEALQRLYNDPETKSFVQKLLAKCTIL